MSHDIGKSVRDRLRSRSAVTNLVGNRIFAGVFDQNAKLPAIAVQVTGGTPEEDLSGTNRIFASNALILCKADDRDTANEVAYQVYSDALPPNLRGSIEGMEWTEVTLLSVSEIEEEPQDGSDNWRRIASLEFVIWNSAV